MTHLIVFSHLRWEFVFQRPQHLLSRLARHYSVVFIEEPVHSNGAAHLERAQPCAGVEVLRPHTAVDAVGFHDDQLSALQPLIASYLADQEIDDYLVWFYTPMALPLLADLTPRAVIYDCMDELAAFKNAPRQMRQRETALLKSADLVLTGGPRLYEAKRASNPNVVCLPSAVDASHYAMTRATGDVAAMERAAALQPDRQPAPWLLRRDRRAARSRSPRPPRRRRSGMADRHGRTGREDRSGGAAANEPTCTGSASSRMRSCRSWSAGWDVCLMPFALNESTEFISPTKTLEYMAAGKPVVSTPIHDVKAMFGDLVAIAATAESFIAACRAALAESPAEKAAREAAMHHRVGCYSWDAAAETVREALDGLSTKPSGLDVSPALEARSMPDEEPQAPRQIALAG